MKVLKRVKAGHDRVCRLAVFMKAERKENSLEKFFLLGIERPFRVVKRVVVKSH